MIDFSLQYPEGKTENYQTLNDETCNDLSIDYICDRVTDSEYEQNIIFKMMTRLESDPEVIKYRRDIFDDILHFPALREKIKDLLEELNYLKELHKRSPDQQSDTVRRTEAAAGICQFRIHRKRL